MEGGQYADVIFISIYAKMGIGASHLNETFHGSYGDPFSIE
jgi:hypothetical protein